MRSTGCGVRNWRQAGIAIALALSSTGFFAASGSAQELGRITGRVQDATTQAPLSDVQVYLQGANLGSLSRQNGVYVILNVPAGTYELRAERIGLTQVTRQITVTAGQAVEANFEMSAQALGLD